MSDSRTPPTTALPASLHLPTPAEPSTRQPIGVVGLDAVLGGGLARGRLHEVYAAEEADWTSAQGFALMLALRAKPGGHIVWVAEKNRAWRIYAPGIAELGADPARLLFVLVKDETTLLKAAADVARSPAAGTLVIAPGLAPKKIDLTATRRLALFAERSGVTVILLRGAGAQIPSAAETRWLIAAAPSTALEADAPGAPAFRADLVRRKGGPPSLNWRLEWDRDAACFSEKLSRHLAGEPGVGLLAS